MPTETLEPTLERRRSQSGLPSIDLANVSVGYDHRRGRIEALSGISLSVHPGEVLGVVGPSGCGKSTLLELVCGLQTPDAGDVEVGGQGSPAERLARCALMFQRDLLFPWRTALDNAALPLELAGRRRGRARAEARKLLRRFDLAEFEALLPDQLSGGMRQRVAFVRTLLAHKPVLALDEPFASLDAITRAQMQEWLVGALATQPRTVLLVTHDIEEALFLCDRVLVVSPRPGSVRAELQVPTPRLLPRADTVTSTDFSALRARAIELLA